MCANFGLREIDTEFRKSEALEKRIWVCRSRYFMRSLSLHHGDVVGSDVEKCVGVAATTEK